LRKVEDGAFAHAGDRLADDRAGMRSDRQMADAKSPSPYETSAVATPIRPGCIPTDRQLSELPLLVGEDTIY
jgi:hypothetical protein